MSSEVKDATQAMTIAQKVATTAGLYFIYVREVRKEGNFWIVSIVCLPGNFTVRIAASTGEVVEFSPIQA